MTTTDPRLGSRIFLLSHMRAFTSLAGHILGSHPEINGYFEMHLSYEDGSALDKQLALYQKSETIKENSRYLFDKLLHNDYVLNPEELGSTDIKILVSLREPEQTLPSIVHLFKSKQTEEPYALPVEAAKYYAERMQALADFCRSLKQDYFYYDAEMFQQAPDVLLPKLTQWLELGSPLKKEYELFNGTGQARKGDSSAVIRRGCISQTRSDYSNIHIPGEDLAQAKAFYGECREAIITNATVSVSRS